MKHLTIGRSAKICSVNIETIRYYERRGLLPAPPRSPSGYRRYSEEAIARIRFIKGAQRIGFTLKEIQELLSLGADALSSSSEVKKRTERKITDIEGKIRSLRKMKKALIQLNARCKGSETTSGCPILEAMGQFGSAGQACGEGD